MFASLANRLRQNDWIALALLIPFLWVALARGDVMPLYWFQVSDKPIIVALIIGLVVTARWAPDWRIPNIQPRPWHLCLVGLITTLMLYHGCYALMGNYPISRDEEMVVFDMAVFAKGHLADPVAAQWREFATDLVPAFLLNEDHPRGFVSAYLPVNAWLRLGFSFITDPALMNPLLVLAGAFALFDIAKRLFTNDNRAIWVTLLIYLLSTQMLVNAMTAYAMTGHMALNLIWLAAFLRGRFWGHAGAIAIATLATGLHQLAFHPLFAAPFVLWRLRQGDCRLALIYSIAYALIIAFWISYPMIVVLQTGVAVVGGGQQDDFLRDRVWPLLVHRDPMTIPFMTLNLLRFIAWQHLALLPLIVGAIPLMIRTRSIVCPLAWGIGIAILFFALVLPFQGHGWGYRYLNPYLGSFALLAGFGYQRLAATPNARTDGAVLLMSVITLSGAFYLLAHTHDFVARHLAIERLVAKQASDFVLIDTDDLPSTDGVWSANAIDIVRNRPDLSNRPLRFSSRFMQPAKLEELCRRGTIATVTRADMHGVGFSLNSPVSSPRFEKLVTAIATSSCLK